MKKILNFRFLFVILVMLIFCPSPVICQNMTFAVDGDAYERYVVYDDNNDVICEKSSVEVGDTFVTKDFYEYEIVDIKGDKAYAKKIGRLQIPKIGRERLPLQRAARKGKICLYMTHNDESYVPSDGYDSVYGAGGIHDVAKSFQRELQSKGIDIVLDETLHIPHNSSAYSRSSVTANKLLTTQSPDAMFDVHRDGVSKSYYETKQNGQNLSKIRIVVGKSNPNFDDNYSFAKYVFAIGNSMYPWLFSDIYCGKGHYNQNYQTTDLLFEMGTYLIEKEAVQNSLPYLANVIDTAMYSSVEEENGDITVDTSAPETNESPIVIENNHSKANVFGIIGWTFVGVAAVTTAGAYAYKFITDKKKNKR